MLLNNSRFSDYLHLIYPNEVEMILSTLKSLLDLYFEIENKGRLKTNLCDKCDDFTFPRVNFAFISSNIPAASAYGVYISQFIRYSRPIQ